MIRPSSTCMRKSWYATGAWWPNKCIRITGYGVRAPNSARKGRKIKKQI